MPTWVEYTKLTFEAIQALAIAMGGAWAFWLFIVQRRLAPQIEFEVDAKLFGSTATGCIAEYFLTFRNKGLTRLKVVVLGLDVRGITDLSQLASVREGASSVKFPELIVDEKNLIPSGWGFIFVEPGVTQTFTHSSVIPAGTAYLRLLGKFEYRRDWPHTAARIIDVGAACK